MEIGVMIAKWNGPIKEALIEITFETLSLAQSKAWNETDSMLIPINRSDLAIMILLQVAKQVFLKRPFPWLPFSIMKIMHQLLEV